MRRGEVGKEVGRGGGEKGRGNGSGGRGRGGKGRGGKGRGGKGRRRNWRGEGVVAVAVLLTLR